MAVLETTLEIHLKNLSHNLRFIRKHLKHSTKILAVVKASGYGSDAVGISKHLEQHQVDYLGVAYVNEGVILRKAGINIPILVLHPQEPNLSTLIEHQLEPSIYSMRILKKMMETSKNEIQYPIHLKFNSGLNRLGFRPEQMNEVIKELQQLSCLKVKGLYSHLAASEDHNEKEFTSKQISVFEHVCKEYTDFTGESPIRHLLNTSGVMCYPGSQYDMVRTGISLYGYSNDPLIDTQLKPVAILKTVISQIHILKKGMTLGYNRAYVAKKETITATLPIGHADGIGRQYGNGNGYVSIQGNKVPIIGNVCMDMMMVDITQIECKEGDEVIVFGDDNWLAEDFASSVHTISYEILTSISSRIKRVII